MRIVSGGLASALLVLLLSTVFALPAYTETASAQQETEKSDATPEYTPPKPLTEAEVSALDVSRLREIARMDSIEHKSPLALFCLGSKYRQSNETATSIDSFRQVLDKYPTHYLAPKACLELAAIYDGGKDYSAEIDILKRMARDYPLYPDTDAGLLRLAFAYRSAGLLDDMYASLDSLENRIGDKKEAVPVLFTSANEYLKNYNSKSAIAKFDKLLAIKDISPSQKVQAMIGKAAAYEYMASTKESALIYEQIIKMDGVDKPARELAERSIKQLASAPAEPLLAPKPTTGEGANAAPKPGRVSDPGTAGTTSEVKVRITD